MGHSGSHSSSTHSGSHSGGSSHSGSFHSSGSSHSSFGGSSHSSFGDSSRWVRSEAIREYTGGNGGSYVSFSINGVETAVILPQSKAKEVSNRLSPFWYVPHSDKVDLHYGNLNGYYTHQGAEGYFEHYYSDSTAFLYTYSKSKYEFDSLQDMQGERVTYNGSWYNGSSFKINLCDGQLNLRFNEKMRKYLMNIADRKQYDLTGVYMAFFILAFILNIFRPGGANTDAIGMSIMVLVLLCVIFSCIRPMFYRETKIKEKYTDYLRDVVREYIDEHSAESKNVNFDEYLADLNIEKPEYRIAASAKKYYERKQIGVHVWINQQVDEPKWEDLVPKIPDYYGAYNEPSDLLSRTDKVFWYVPCNKKVTHGEYAGVSFKEKGTDFESEVNVACGDGTNRADKGSLLVCSDNEFVCEILSDKLKPYFITETAYYHGDSFGLNLNDNRMKDFLPLVKLYKFAKGDSPLKRVMNSKVSDFGIVLGIIGLILLPCNFWYEMLIGLVEKMPLPDTLFSIMDSVIYYGQFVVTGIILLVSVVLEVAQHIICSEVILMLLRWKTKTYVTYNKYEYKGFEEYLKMRGIAFDNKNDIISDAYRTNKFKE